MSKPRSGNATFHITEHVVPCHHIREDVVRTGVKDGADWRMSVKQYTPRSNLHPSQGDITILSAPALGYPKELYEPLWEDLYSQLVARGLRIKSIWIADPANLGSSAKLNTDVIYDSVNPSDHARDLYNLVNHFPESFTHPILGIGHSIGGTHLAHLSFLHPGLFTSLILLDPILVSSPSDGNATFLANFALSRPYVFPSRDIARIGFSKAFKKCDARVLELFMTHGLRDAATGQSVELVAGKFQETVNYVRAKHMAPASTQTIEQEDEKSIQWAATPPRINSIISMISKPTLIIAGGRSPAAKPTIIDDWKHRFGSYDLFRRPGQERQVKIDVIEKGSHFFPFEDPKGTGSRAGEWIERVVGKDSSFQREKESVRIWRELDSKRKQEVVEEWMKEVKSKL